MNSRGQGRRNSRSGRAASQAGFTLIEILIVMMIIGILAAIAFPRFLAVQDKAKDANAKASAGLASLAMETWASDHDGYAAVTVADLEQVEPVLRDAPNLTISSSSVDEYELQTVSTSNPTTTFTVRRTTTGMQRTCVPAGGGGCPTYGSW
jgi:prepilin-type N-terminal cleavage/methylation domain-containing protein